MIPAAQVGLASLAVSGEEEKFPHHRAQVVVAVVAFWEEQNLGGDAGHLRPICPVSIISMTRKVDGLMGSHRRRLDLGNL